MEGQNLYIQKLYIIGVNVLGENRKGYGLVVLKNVPNLYPSFVLQSNTPEGLAEIIYDTYHRVSEGNPSGEKRVNVIIPVGKQFLGSPETFPITGYLDDRLVNFFELNNEEHTQFINKLRTLLK